MKTKIYILLVALFISTNVMNAQTIVKSTDVSIANLGYNNLYIEYTDKSKNPIIGKIRIVNETLAEYTDVYLNKGNPEGKYETYMNDRLKEVITFKNGYMDGPMSDYFPNGDKKYEINFKHGERDGYARVYSSNGELMAERFYVNGQISGKEYVVIQKGLAYKKTCFYKNGLLDGEYYEEWIANNNPKAKGLYVDGEKEGKWTEWNSDGKISSQDIYVRGVKQ